MSWLQGTIEVPFVLVAAMVGVVTVLTLVYLARRQKPKD